MKIGMNMLLWATHVTEEHYPHLEKIKSTGFDGVEIPIFGGDDAHYRKLRKKLDELQLKTSTVAVATPEANAISPDPATRKAAAERLKMIVRQSAILGADILCGPIHQALGVFSGTGPTEEEFKRAADVHREVADEAQRQGVCLAIEFLNRFECYFLNTAAAAAAYVRRALGIQISKGLVRYFPCQHRRRKSAEGLFRKRRGDCACPCIKQRPRRTRARTHRFSSYLSRNQIERI